MADLQKIVTRELRPLQDEPVLQHRPSGRAYVLLYRLLVGLAVASVAAALVGAVDLGAKGQWEAIGFALTLGMTGVGIFGALAYIVKKLDEL